MVNQFIKSSGVDRNARLLNDVKYEKGSFTLYDRTTDTLFRNSKWEFLFNPELITTEMAASYSSLKFSGGNHPAIISNGIESEIWRFTLLLTADTPSEAKTETPQTNYDKSFGRTTVRITPATDSISPSGDTDIVPNLFEGFGKRDMVTHIEHLKSLMMTDRGREWRVVFKYGRMVNVPQVFMLTGLSVAYNYCDSDLLQCVLATLDVELMVDATNLYMPRSTHLNLIKHTVGIQ